MIGREFDWDLISIVTQMAEDELVPGLGNLFEKKLIREQRAETFDFSHDQIREVAYNHIPIPRRKILHRHVAEAITRICRHTEPAAEHLLNVNAAQIAVHYEKAGSLYQAFQFFTRAAENAARIFAHQESEALYGSAIRLARQLNWPGTQLVRLYAARGRSLEHLGRFADAIQAYTDLEALAGERNDAQMQCVALARMAACYNEPSAVHNPTLAKPLLSKGLAIARAIGAYELEAQMQWSLLISATHYGKAEEGRAAAEVCLAVARSHNLKELLAICLHDYALHLRLCSDVEYGNTCAQEARAIFRGAGNLAMLVDSLNQQALIDCMQLDFRSSQEFVSEAVQTSRSIQNNWNLAYAGWIQGMLNEAQGKWNLAQTCFEESIRIGQEAGFLMSLTTVKLLHGDLLRRLGQLEKALVLHQEALDASLHQASFMLFACQAQLALDYFAEGDLQTGKRCLQDSQAHDLVGVIGPCIGLPFVSHALADWAVQSGEWQPAIDSIAAILREVQRRNLPYDQVQVGFDYGCCLEGAGQADQALSVFLTILPTVEKCHFYRLQSQLAAALAAHFESQGNRAEQHKYLRLAKLENSFLR